MAAKRYSDGGGKRFREEPPKRKSKKKLAIVLVSLLAACTVATTGTIAYLTTATAPVVNTFSPTNTVIEIPEGFDGETKSNVTVKNKGDIPVYIRAAVVITWENNTTREMIPAKAEDYTITWFDSNSGWVKGNDGFYYYTKAVSPPDNDATTTDDNITAVLIKECKPVAEKAPENCFLSVEIIANAIQATPAEAVENAWGIEVDDTSGNLTGQPVTSTAG